MHETILRMQNYMAWAWFEYDIDYFLMIFSNGFLKKKIYRTYPVQ